MLRYLFLKLLKRELKIKEDLDTHISYLNLKEYTLDALSTHGLLTVKDVLIAYIKLEHLSGVGKSTWEDFFNNIK